MSQIAADHVLAGEVPNAPAQPEPPSHKLPPGEWVKKNLFSLSLIHI